MTSIIHKQNGITVQEITHEGILIRDVQDIIDLMSDSSVRKFIIRKENFHQDFFDLRTGIAGDILQKASTYRISIGIVGDFNNIQSKSLRDFIYESNKTGQILFKDSVDEVLTNFLKETEL